MLVVVFNCGSSSLSYKVFDVSPDARAPRAVASGKAHRVACAGTSAGFIEHRAPPAPRDARPGVCASHAAAAAAILDSLAARGLAPQAAGHRFAHGGTLVTAAAAMKPFRASRDALARCIPLAPIHNAAAVAVIDVCAEKLGEDAPQYFVLDTAFHSALEPRAYTYALPLALAKEHGLRRFGFHGLSYQYVTEELAAFLGGSLAGTRVVACHLGTGGSSAAAIRDGKSVDTTMGWSSWSGLVMSTRTGDIDSGIPLALVQRGMSVADITRVLVNESGLTGLTAGLTSDLRDVYDVSHDASRPREDSERCQLAWDVYVHRLVSSIGQLSAAMDGVTALLFTDDLGFDLPQLRAAACARLAWMGVALDEEKNRSITRATLAAADRPVAEVSAEGSKVRVFVVLNDEELVIAREASRLLF